MQQYLISQRKKCSKRGRDSKSRYGGHKGHRSRTPVNRKRPRYSYSKSRSPDAYQKSGLEFRIKDHTFDNSGNSPRRRQEEHRMLLGKFHRFDDSLCRGHVDFRREENGRFDRFDDMTDRNPLSHEGARERFARYRGTPERFDDTPDQSPVSRIDDRGNYDKFGDIPDRSPLSYREERETFDRFDEAQGHSSMENKGSEHSNSSYEYPTDRRSRRMSLSPYSNEDVHSINRHDTRGRGILFESESRYENDDFNEYGKGIFDRNRKGKHFSSIPGPVICKFYNNEGTCKKGDSCKFLHVCKYFVKDDCKFGPGCMRCHDVLDKQPRTILEKYDMIPNHYIPGNFTNTREIIDLVKDKLKNLAATFQRDNTKSNFNRSIFQHPTNNRISSFRTHFDRIYDDETDGRERRREGDTIVSPRSNSSKDILSDEIPKPSQSSADFIPFELNVQTEIKNEKVTKKKRKKTKKINKRSKKCGDNSPIRWKGDKETDSTQQCEYIKNVPNVPTNVPTITFESQNSCRKFQVRKADDHWQISHKSDVWVSLDEADSESFCEMYNRAFEIGEKVVEMIKE